MAHPGWMVAVHKRAIAEGWWTANMVLVRVQCTYRQLDHWTRKGWLGEPERMYAERVGTSGNQRFYDDGAVRVAQLLYELSLLGIARFDFVEPMLPNVRNHPDVDTWRFTHGRVEVAVHLPPLRVNLAKAA